MQLGQNFKKIRIKGRRAKRRARGRKGRKEFWFWIPGQGFSRALNATAFQVETKATSSGLRRTQLTPSFLGTPPGPLLVPTPQGDWQSRGGGFSRHSLSHGNQPPASPPGRGRSGSARSSRTRGTGNRAAGGEQAREPGQLTGRRGGGRRAPGRAGGRDRPPPSVQPCGCCGASPWDQM